MSAADDVRRRMVRLEALTQDVFTDVVLDAALSIVEGSAVTGAPGQPVDTGQLKASWQAVEDAPLVATIGTNLEYAQPIEEGIGPHGPLTLRSPVGGFHSVKMTVAGMDRIVAQAVARASAGGDA